MGYIKDVKIGNDTHLIEPILYGTCNTAADVAAKVVDIPNFELVTGVRITVYFGYQNIAVNATLNVNSTGAKSIYYTNREGTSVAGYSTSSTAPRLRGLQYFIYDGRYWRLEEDTSSLGKYLDDTSYGIKTFKNTSTSNYYLKLGYTSGGIEFNYDYNGTNFCTTLRMLGYTGDSSSYIPTVGFSKATKLQAIAAPTTDTDAANKKYVDDKFALALPLTGGTLTGALTLAADPTTNLGAATKQYVDTAVSNVTASIEVVRLI